MSKENKITEVDSIKRIACDFFYWWYNQSGTNTQQGFDEWQKQNSERLKNFEHSIRKDEHEKSCRAQRIKCVYQYNQDASNTCLPLSYDGIADTPLADFNDTITE